MTNNKIKLCDKCNSSMTKKSSGANVYYECSYCGEKEERSN